MSSSFQQRLQRKTEDCFVSSKCVEELSESAFNPFRVWELKKWEVGVPTLLLYYVPWCIRCQEMHAVFCAAAAFASFADFCAFNCEKRCRHFQTIRDDLPSLVRTFPTLVGYQNGRPVEEFRGPRSTARLVQFCMRLALQKDPDPVS